MDQFVFSLVLRMGVFAVYWSIRFRHVLPLEARAQA